MLENLTTLGGKSGMKIELMDEDNVDKPISDINKDKFNNEDNEFDGIYVDVEGKMMIEGIKLASCQLF